jgi:hypothetical protein
MANDGYTLKELVGELRQEQKLQTQHTASILASLENIDKHLTQLNSKVASHEKRFVKLESFQTKVMTAWGIATFIIVTAANKFL